MFRQSLEQTHCRTFQQTFRWIHHKTRRQVHLPFHGSTGIEPVANQPNSEPDSSKEPHYKYERQSVNPIDQQTSPDLYLVPDKGEVTFAHKKGSQHKILISKNHSVRGSPFSSAKQKRFH